MIEQKSLTPEDLSKLEAAKVAREQEQAKPRGWPPIQGPAEQQTGDEPARG
jgi:hypothetical protein